MSSRIAVMNRGELQQFAAPLTCYYRPTNEFVAGFIGSPSMNFLDGTVTDEGVETEQFTLDVDDGVLGGDVGPGTSVTVGVRPEDIYLAEGADIEDDEGPVGAADATDMDGRPSDPIDVTTTVLEPVGDDVYVYTEFGHERTSADGQSSAAGDGASETDGFAATDEAAEEESGETAQTDDSTLLMSMPPIPDMDTDAAEGQRTRVVLDRTMVHLFDSETGDAIVHGLTADAESRSNRTASGGQSGRGQSASGENVS